MSIANRKKVKCRFLLNIRTQNKSILINIFMVTYSCSECKLAHNIFLLHALPVKSFIYGRVFPYVVLNERCHEKFRFLLGTWVTCHCLTVRNFFNKLGHDCLLWLNYCLDEVFEVLCGLVR